jgi:hypothetical protein
VTPITGQALGKKLGYYGRTVPEKLEYRVADVYLEIVTGSAFESAALEQKARATNLTNLKAQFSTASIVRSSGNQTVYHHSSSGRQVPD